LRLYQTGADAMNEMEELSKIKYSLEGLIKKRIDIIQKDSIESRFA
jgi:predicted nucleotidyltransferase